ncbi:MAG: porin [bacterium]
MKTFLLPVIALVCLGATAQAQQFTGLPVRRDSMTIAAAVLAPARAEIDSSRWTMTPSVGADRKPATAADTGQVPAMMLNLGNVVFGGNLQTFYVAGSGDVVNTFKLRRAELKFVGTMSPTVKWQVMLDLAKSLKVANNSPTQSTLPLQDAFISVKADRFDIQAGQFILPLTYEGGGLSSALIEATDRSLMITDGKLGQVRDMGVQLSTQLFSVTKVRVGLFNSTGDLQNTTAITGAKAIVGRIETRTPVDGLMLGMSGASAGRDANDEPAHDRIGGDVEYSWKRFGARSEFMRAWDGTDVRLGTYGLATYSVGTVLLVGRYDYWDKDSRASLTGLDVLERDVTAGFAWYMEGSNVVLRGNYVWRNLHPQPQRDQVIVSLQAAW